MKKIIALAAIALFMISCSEDDSQTTNPADTVLLKKMTSTDEDGNVITYNYTYDGNKLVGMLATDGSSAAYTYTGDHITYSKHISSQQTMEYFYDFNEEGKVISEFNKAIFHEADFAVNVTSTYIYNDDGSTSVHVISDFEEGEDTENNYKIIYTGNTMIYDYSENFKYTYNYDGKNSPFKNVLGLQQIDQSQNLLTLFAKIPDPTVPEPVMLNNNTYIYNDANYPVSGTLSIGDYYTDVIETRQYQYFYE